MHIDGIAKADVQGTTADDTDPEGRSYRGLTRMIADQKRLPKLPELPKSPKLKINPLEN